MGAVIEFNLPEKVKENERQWMCEWKNEESSSSSSWSKIISAFNKVGECLAWHRSLGVGFVHCSICVLCAVSHFFHLFSPSFQHGVNLYAQDKEGLSALDLVMKDRPAFVTFKNTGRSLHWDLLCMHLNIHTIVFWMVGI